MKQPPSSSLLLPDDSSRRSRSGGSSTRGSSATRSRLELTAILAVLSLFASAERAGANGPVGENGTPIQTSAYAIDLFRGPVFAGSRVTGLAGAYVAIAEDVDGDLQNPAAPAVRPFFSYTNFDYWLGLGLTFPATLEDTDFFNSGSKTHIANPPDSFVFFSPALNLQFGEFGIGANVEVQNYALSERAADEQGASILATIPITHLQLAHGLMHNQWVFGVGARIASLSVREDQGPTLFTSTGTGFELGGVYKPEQQPFRVGAAFRTSIRTDASYRDELLPNSDGDLVISTSDGRQVFLPKAVALPWDLNLGFAMQFGPRAFNPPWRTTNDLGERQLLTHRLRAIDRESQQQEALKLAKTPEETREIERAFEREQGADDAELVHELAKARQRIEDDLVNLNRFYVQISTSVLVSGAVEEALGVESLVTQTVNRSGEKTVVSVRLGVESGVIPEWLRVRAGSYLEPSRFEGSHSRLHGTVGFDVRLIRWNVFGLWPDDYLWRLGVGADIAHRYYTWGVTLAGWYPRHSQPSDAPDPVQPDALTR
jgi:hypothetical protein